MEKHKYALRTARDTLMGQLGLAASQPLPDVPVSVEEAVVSYGNSTWVAIADSQPDVRYELRDSAGGIIGGRQAGTGGTLRLPTGPLVNEEYTFRVWATRTGYEGASGGALVQLRQAVSVQVGLDTALATSLQDDAIAYGAAATVVVHGAQSNVRYRLLDNATEAPLSEAVETASSGDVSLLTVALKEDVTLVVKATNVTTNLSALLTQRVPVRVQPKVDLAATLTPAVVDYNGQTTIRLAGSQQTVSYQLQLATNSLDTTLAAPEEVTAVPGTGEALSLPTGALREDCLASITATKTGSGLAAVLRVRVFIPVRPDPAKELLLVKDLTEIGKNTVVQSVAAGTAAIIKVANTQRGVRYQLRIGLAPVGMPAYHHINAGIGKARVAFEFAVGTFSDDSVYLPTGVLAQTTEFNVFAFKPTREAEGVVVGTISVAVQPSST